MKSFVLALFCASLASPSAFAFKKVQFDADIRLEICPLKEDGTCTHIDPGEFLRHETIIADDPSGGAESSPVYSVTAVKEYQLNRLFGASYDLVLQVDFFHAVSAGRPLVMAVTLGQGSDPGGLRPNDHAATVSMPDLAAFQQFTMQGETKIQTMPAAPNLALTPSVWISNVKVLD